LLEGHVEVSSDRRAEEFEVHRLIRPGIQLLERDVWQKGDTLAGTQGDGGLVSASDRHGTG
jgi:hypothetical protein